MRRALFAAALAVVFASPGAAQQVPDQTTVIDSIDVVGNHRTSRTSILSWARIPTGEPVSYRSLQRAMSALYATGQFGDIAFAQATLDDKQVLRITVAERPMVTNWTVRGVDKLSERRVRGKVKLLSGRPYDPDAAWRSKAAIDSLYQQDGYYQTSVDIRTLPQPDSSIRVVFDVNEGRRVTVSQVLVDGNEQVDDGAVVGSMSTKPEGFWWFRTGEFNEDRLDRDVRDRLPGFYASKGFIDFQVLRDTLQVDSRTGKASLALTVDEGAQYRVASFEVVGNRQFSTEQLQRFVPFGTVTPDGRLKLEGPNGERPVFDQAEWDQAQQQVTTLYANEGYLYVQVQPILSRRVTPDSQHVVDLRWQITEGNPAVVNRVEIRGNQVTYEDVVRRAIVIIPGDVLRQDALIHSYQNVSNLGFFEQPVPIPDINRINDQGDVNVVFHVVERHTGSVNFGATVGQGTGLGGFIGLTEPNLMGRGKTVSVQWQFGRNITDFNISYTDPAIRGGLISGTVTLRDSRLRYTVADLGRIRSRGGSVQIGFPLFGSRYTRLFTSYTLEQNQYDSPTISSVFYCRNCVRSSVGVSITRDTRVQLPFPTGGVMHRIDVSQNGGILGGSGNFQRLVLEGRWYAPLATLGDVQSLGSAARFVVGLSAQAGFVWGNPGPHFQQLFSMGGTQFGIPLRGYDEFSITPRGFDPQAQGFQASAVGAFGRSYFQTTAELGLRLNQSIYFSTFLDGGNVWATPAQFDPTHLFRGAGVGVSLVTPIGPIGLDYAYGFDRTDALGNPNPGWKFHFKLGNFF